MPIRWIVNVNFLALKKTTLLRRENQRQIFHLLHDFAFKVSVRYTGIESDPVETMYKAFTRLFQQTLAPNSADLTFLNETIRKLIINICVDQEKHSHNVKQRFAHTPVSNYSDTVEIFSLLSNKQIIDTLRTIPFSFRMVYNMSVIDRYKEQTISSMLQMSASSVDRCLRSAREQLAGLLMHTLSMESELS